MHIITARIKVKEGHSEAFIKAVEKIAPLFLKDPGCRMYTVQQRLDDPRIFLI